MSQLTSQKFQRRYFPQLPKGGTISITCQAVKTAKRPKQAGTKGSPQIIQVDPEGSDIWRLDQAIEMLKDGAVGIIPTDTFPALVCDLENKSAAQTLLELKGAAASKKLSLLCRDFSDISHYTHGFPVANRPGDPNFFRIAKEILPGAYTFILKASKALPRSIVDFESGKTKHRSTVGVRIPDDIICSSILEQLDRPLLCSSAAVREEDGVVRVAEAARLADEYGPRGLSFIVDVGPRLALPSSVIDLTGDVPVLVREGKGDCSWLVVD